MRVTTPDYRATYRRYGQGWKGVVRAMDGTTVAECRHWHHNRDLTTITSGPSARACAQALLEAIVMPHRTHDVSVSYIPSHLREYRWMPACTCGAGFMGYATREVAAAHAAEHLQRISA